MSVMEGAAHMTFNPLDGRFKQLQGEGQNLWRPAGGVAGLCEEQHFSVCPGAAEPEESSSDLTVR